MSPSRRPLFKITLLYVALGLKWNNEYWILGENCKGIINIALFFSFERGIPVIKINNEYQASPLIISLLIWFVFFSPSLSSYCRRSFRRSVHDFLIKRFSWTQVLSVLLVSEDFICCNRCCPSRMLSKA